MQFNSFTFIMVFLPLTVFLYFIANKVSKEFGKWILLVASILFYVYADPSVFWIMGISLIVNYGFSLLISLGKKWNRIFIAIPVVTNIGLLLYFKYLNFAILNVNNLAGTEIPLKSLILPVGISFFTFQQIAYLVAVHRKELEKNRVIDYLVYILYFPKILMGPLTEPADFISQLNDDGLKKVNWDQVAFGIKIFSLGLFKKVMLADVFAKAVEWGFAYAGEATSMDLILVMLFYTFEIYFDFSGYSDMAVGASSMLNITLPMNFDSPYKAISIRDFWKRWHISLTRFFTKYIYIPLGGSKKGMFLTCANTMLVFLISGIWHGANWTFILWGILHGVFSVIDRCLDRQEQKIGQPARWIGTFTTINVLWLLFRSESIRQWKDILVKMIGFQNLNISDGLLEIFYLPETTFLSNVLHLEKLVQDIRGFWMVIYFMAAFGICLVFENNYRKLKEISWGSMLISAVAFIWGVICLSGESVFVYFNF